jgi:hypothetical protein
MSHVALLWVSKLRVMKVLHDIEPINVRMRNVFKAASHPMHWSRSTNEST